MTAAPAHSRPGPASSPEAGPGGDTLYAPYTRYALYVSPGGP